MRLKGKTIGILVGPGYEDLEFRVPYMRMQEDGAEVKVIGTKAGEIYTGKSGGLTVESHIAAKEITVKGGNKKILSPVYLRSISLAKEGHI